MNTNPLDLILVIGLLCAIFKHCIPNCISLFKQMKDPLNKEYKLSYIAGFIASLIILIIFIRVTSFIIIELIRGNV